LGPDLATLVDLVATDRLRIEIGWCGSWERIDDAAAALADRSVSGKAILDPGR
jgi:hypothetical protein